jgi:DNA-binding CsgD family transcriptional regulator
MKRARFLSKNPSKAKHVGQPLTARENEVLWLITEGLSNKVIADRLDISTHTVKFHLMNAGKKIGSTSRTKAAVDFIRYQGNSAQGRGDPTSASSEFTERRNKRLEATNRKDGESTAAKDNWISGFAVALAQVHRHSGGSTVVCETARHAGLTLAVACRAGVSSFDLEELERAKVP